MQSLPLILASSSPRRKTLLSESGYTFTVEEPHPAAEDEPRGDERPVEVVGRLAYQKGADVAARVGRGLVLACDTVADLDGEILGKPDDLAHARRMLGSLRGRDHHVHSGICLWPVPQGSPVVRVATTTLHMAALSDDQLEEYLASGLWKGKAGSFGYQDRHGWLEIKSGSESNVVGLPLELLAEMLADLGISIVK